MPCDRKTTARLGAVNGKCSDDDMPARPLGMIESIDISLLLRLAGQKVKGRTIVPDVIGCESAWNKDPVMGVIGVQ